MSLMLSSLSSSNISQISDSVKNDFGNDSLEFEKIFITGGGSFKFAKELTNIFGSFFVSDEMSSLVNGIYFILDHLQSSSSSCLKYPLLLANAGTGASFILIDEKRNLKRIGGTNIAGGTLRGIFNILNLNDQSEMDSQIRIGNKLNADILVKDIYGSAYESVDLDGNIVAGSLAKLDHYQGTNFQADICSSSAYMICSNLIHLICLYANIHGLSMVLFSGSFPSIPSVSSILTTLAKSTFSENIEFEILKFGGYIGCFGIVSEIISKF